MKIYINSKLRYLFIICIFVFLDQFSKLYINLNINELFNKELVIFTVDYVRNFGAAFNIFSGSRLFLSLISLISTIILTNFIFLREDKVINKYGLSFILSGSIGNGIDRFYYGYVIDFIKIKYIDFPVFNIADIAINIGVVIMILSYLRNKH